MKSYAIVAALAALSCIGLQTATAFEVEYAEIRMTPWSYLTSAQRLAASNLGYTEKKWNNPGTELAEKVTWEASTLYDYYDKDGDNNYYDVVPFEVYASQLGFTGENKANMWDCWVTHYNYYWADIVKYGLLPAFTALGWTEDMWDNENGEPRTESLAWYELSTAEKTAAVVLCYVKPLWDEKPLWDMCNDSPRDFRKSKTSQKSCDWVSQDLTRCDIKNGAPFSHCKNTCGSCDWNKCKNSSLRWKLKVKNGKTIFKKCRYTEKNTKKKCSKPGMKETCPQQCNPCPA